MKSPSILPGLTLLPLLGHTAPATAQCVELPLRVEPALENNSLGSVLRTDGGTVVVSAPGNSETVQQAGAAYVFEYGVRGFEHVASFYPSQPEIAGGFARDVAVDGDWILVGTDDHEHGFSTGAVLAYRRTDAGWTFAQKLTSLTPTHAESFGTSVAIEGGRAVIGAIGNSLELGSAYVFEYIGGLWRQVAQVVPVTPGTTYNFGMDVALSGDRMLVGTGYDDPGTGHTGAAYLFEKSGDAWTQVARLVGHDSGFTDVYGQILDLEDDTAVVTAWGHGSSPETGAAYVFQRRGAQWLEAAKLVSSAPNGSRFGSSVHVSGGRVAIGSRSSGGFGFSQSSAEVFRRGPAGWGSELLQWGPPGTSGIGFGDSIGLWGDSLLVGNPTASPGASFAGEVAFFDLGEVGASSYCSATPNSTGRAAEMELACPGLEDGRLPLRAAPVPDTVGLFLLGDETAAAPMGDGLRCVGGGMLVSRPLVSSDGVLALDLELGGPGFEAVLPGTTWHVQAYFHEPSPAPGGASFQLSDALTVTLAP